MKYFSRNSFPKNLNLVPCFLRDIFKEVNAALYSSIPVMVPSLGQHVCVLSVDCLSMYVCIHTCICE